MASRVNVANSDQLPLQISGGLIPAVPVPFDSGHKLHSKAHDSYLRYMSSQPIAGVAVWAHTGRGLFLPDEVAQTVLVGWREALPNKTLIAGVGARVDDLSSDKAVAATIEMAERAAKFGADALLVYPPNWLRHVEDRDRLIVEFHSQLSRLGLPLVLFYLYEAAGGINYTSAVLDELLSMEGVAGIKVATLDSVMTYQDIARQIQLKYPNKLLITGEDRFLGYSLQRGAKAALIGMGAVCGELQSELITAHIEGNAQRFIELSNAVDKLAETLFIDPMEGYIGRILWALVQQGVIPREAAYDPWGPQLNPEEFEIIGKVVEEISPSHIHQGF